MLASSQIWDCARHHILETLSRATLVRSRPFLIRLSDVAADLEALQCAWEQHVAACSDTMFRGLSPLTEGGFISLAQAWRGGGMSIQHDLDDVPCTQNPVVDFLRQHGKLKLSSMWCRVERWIEDRIGHIARRPAFITGMHSTTTATHFDEYDSLVFVLKGAKAFHVARPEAVKQTGRRMMHESTAHPYKPGTIREQASPQPFERIDVPAGRLLFLPARWWHFVESTPNTLMVCAWVEESGR
ncbi:MAG: cupin-like domain-containing protein [Verrucomicrobiota bacterium]|nr:cupin-like domain-containing protein [Verrucomicrobiota bacterium]